MYAAFSVKIFRYKKSSWEEIAALFGGFRCNGILEIDFYNKVQVKNEKAEKYAAVCQLLMRDVCRWVVDEFEKEAAK
jgi:predicted metal-binding protein